MLTTYFLYSQLKQCDPYLFLEEQPNETLAFQRFHELVPAIYFDMIIKEKRYIIPIPPEVGSKYNEEVVVIHG